MSWWRGCSRRAFTRREREHDIDREIRAHLELEAEEQHDGGMSVNEARDAAQRAFGNRLLITEDVRAIWGTPPLDALLQDVRYALRTMRRAPGFAAVAVVSSALGIAGCSVIFAIFNFAVLRPLPVDEPGRLMNVSEINRRTGEVGGALSYPDFRDLRQARSFEDMAAIDPLVPASIGSGGDPQRHWGALVTANYFAVVKPRFALGRGFDPDRDDTRGAPPSVVLSHDLWQLRFAGDAGIIGRSVSINRRLATVTGVTAAGFRGTAAGVASEFWIPFSMIDEIESRLGPVTANRQRRWLEVIARLRAGVDVHAARAELDVIARTLNAPTGRGDRGFYIERAGPIHPELRRIGRPLFAVSLTVTALVLLTACSNVAMLFLGRASARRREIAARMALGASRSRLVRQLLTESLVLALAGGVVGAMIAAYISSLLRLVRVPLGWPLHLSIALDFRALLFSIVVSILTAVAFGLVPALRATKPDLIADLKAGGQGGAERHRLGLRHVLVAAQVAVCTVLLLCMGLFLRSLRATRATDLGLSHRNLLLMAFDPALLRSDLQSRQLLRDILERAHAVPGVESATLTTEVPLTLIMNNSRFVPEEQAADPRAPRIRTDIYMVGPQFFRTLGIPFLTGEDFDVAPSATRRAAIVNAAFARAAFPNQSPLGRHVLGDGKRLEIVGVVTTAKSRAIGEDPRPAIYLPILSEYLAAQTPRGVTLVAKAGDAEPAAYAPALREAIRRADRSLAVFDVRTMESHVTDALLVPRLAWMLSAAAAGVGLVIATIGVYGVVSFAVVRRRRELGIRLAIGARPREVLMMILGQGIRLALIGTALGVVAALGATRFAVSLLYGVSPVDPATFVVAPLFLLAVVLLACLLPARAAARLDPVEVLRSE